MRRSINKKNDGRESPEIDKFVEDLFFNMIHPTTPREKEKDKEEEEEEEEKLIEKEEESRRKENYEDEVNRRKDEEMTRLKSKEVFAISYDSGVAQMEPSVSSSLVSYDPSPDLRSPSDFPRSISAGFRKSSKPHIMEKRPMSTLSVMNFNQFLGPLQPVSMEQERQRLVAESGMSTPTSVRKGSYGRESLFPEITEVITSPDGGRGLNSYDLISRTLHQLARDGNSEVLSAALSRLGEQVRRRINNLDSDKLAPLHYAARYAHAETVKTLIQAGAQVNIRGQDQLTPLHFAARYRKQIKSARKVSPSVTHIDLKKRAKKPVDTIDGGGQDNDGEGEAEDDEDEQDAIEETEPEEQPEIEDDAPVEEDEDPECSGIELQEMETEIEEEGEEEENEGEEEEEDYDVGNEEDTHELVEVDESDQNKLVVGSLHSAVSSIGRDSDIDQNSVVKILVDSGAEVNARDIYGQTPLHFAAMRGNDPAAVDLLACPHILIEARDKQLMTPLYVASTYGYVRITKLLLNAGANLLSKDESAQTPLHRAAMEGNAEIVSHLLEVAKGHKDGENLLKRLVRECDTEHETALHHAVHNGHVSIAAELLQVGADVNAMNTSMATPLHAAAAVGDSDLIKLLLKNRARLECVDCDQQTPLHRAADHDQADAVNLLLAAGANIEKRDKDSFTPLLIAASSGQAAAAQALLDNGAELEAVDKEDKTSVFWCAEQGNLEALEVLLQNPRCMDIVDVSDRADNSPLHMAAVNGYVRIIDSLIMAGSKIDNKNEDGETALHLAAEEGQVKVVRELIKKSILLISDQNEEANTPLHLACLQGHHEVVKVLLQAGADVQARNTSLWTPLDCAAAKGQVLCVHLLLDYDAPLDPMDKSKTTPLQLAAKEGHVATTRLLLERGASLESCDASGRNALELAISAGKKDVCMAIIRSSEWVTSLKNVRHDYKGRRVTPFRMLIRKFPEVAEAVLDRCTTTNGMDSDDRRFEVIFNFELVDDTYATHPFGKGETDSISSSSLDSPYDDDGLLFDDAEPYTSDARELKSNHPLILMIRYKRLNLLAHPVSVTLVKHKWMKFARLVYYSTLVFYSIFLTFLTGYILSARTWDSFQNETTLSPDSQIKVQAAIEMHSCKDIEEELNLSHSIFVVYGKWVIIVMAAINILREMFQFYQARLNYLGIENLLEWACYITAVLVVWDFNECKMRERWQWQVAAASIFMAWMNLLLFIRKFPYFGIFVVMFTDIFSTFLRLLVVFILFIVAFALSFHTVLSKQQAFNTPGNSLIKTTVMMIGEFEFDSIFNEAPLDYPEISYIIFVTFLILMSILLMNLLVGLAVDDIKAVQDQAVLKKLAMQTQMVIDVEVLIPETLRRLHMVSKKCVHPNARHGILSRLFGDFQLIKGFEFLDSGEELEMGLKEYLRTQVLNEHETMRRDLTHVMGIVEDLRSQNLRLHALLTALMNFSKKDDGEAVGDSNPDLSKYIW